MPGDDGVRLDDLNGRAPATPRLREPDPHYPVSRCETKTGAPRSIDYAQLVSERDDLQVQRGARADHELERVEQGDQDGRHERRLSKNAGNLNRRNAYGVFGRHSAPPTIIEPYLYRSLMISAGLCDGPFATLLVCSVCISSAWLWIGAGVPGPRQ